MNRLTAWMVLAALAVAASAHGSGMLIPKDESIPPLAIKYQRVDIDIKDAAATAKIEQVFQNSTDRDLEAVYVFPLPAGASIDDFAMYINGKRMSGELVEKDKARRIYQDIVRRMKDPGLLEQMDGNLFRVSVYPVPRNGEQKFELVYTQTLDFEAGLYRYVYPLRTAEQASKTLEDFTVSVRLRSSQPIHNVYSPSHEVGISRKNDHEAVIGFEQEQATLDRDFVLYYGIDKKDFGLNLLAHANAGKDGFFMMMLAPRIELEKNNLIRKDITFVFDTSGSMAGKKIKQARKALDYCIRKLNDGDRFNVIRFSTDVEPFRKTLTEANEESREAALAFVADIEARGGTDIDGALAAALGMDYDEARPKLIVFLTDGKPTIGETDTPVITGNVEKGNKTGIRVFTFGVGEEINTHLLDKIAGANGGISQYVTPDEDIEVKLSSFSDKISYPVLGDLAVSVDKMTLKQMHPAKLPDLFSGDQILLFGRYEGSGHVAIRLTGRVNGKKREFVYEATFPESSPDNGFIPRLWATRRVGYLLDEIRLHGEIAELKDEVLRLSREYGIMTPYTSYLVLETEADYDRHNIPRSSHRPAGRDAQKELQKQATGIWSDGAQRRRLGDKEESREKDQIAAMPLFGADEASEQGQASSVPDALSATRNAEAPAPGVYVRPNRQDVNGYLGKKSGEQAIDLSRAIADYKSRKMSTHDIDTVRHVAGRIFYRVNGVWIDGNYKKTMRRQTIRFAADDYFKLVEDKPELRPFLALGQRVIVVLDDQTALCVE